MTTIWSHRPCRNCGQTHPLVPGSYSTDCLLIGGKYRNKSQRRQHQCHNHLTLPLPTSIREQALLFDDIWFCFHDIQHENIDLRRELATLKLGRGGVRQYAPLLWLRWKRADGTKGQTRNQENYEKLWKTFVHKTSGTGQDVPVAWLTICAMPCPQSPFDYLFQYKQEAEFDDIIGHNREKVSFPFCKAPGSPVYTHSLRMGQAR